MIVYLLVHLPTEMSYVGSTEKSVKHRFNAHWEKRRKESSELSKALRNSNIYDWIYVELESYDDIKSMLDGERYWIIELGTLNPGVGYNSQVPRSGDIEARIKKLIQSDLPTISQEDCNREENIAHVTNNSLDMSFEEIVKMHKAMSKTLRIYKKNLPLEQKIKISQKASAKGASWWNSLTEEQKEEHRQKARARSSKSKP